MKLKLVFIIFFITIASSFSQLKKSEVLDKVVAIVGDEAITDSEVKGRIIFLIQQNPKLKFDDPKVYSDVLNSIIDEKLILAKAKEDSITVTDEEIEQRWQLFLEQSIMQLGSEQRVEQVYGMSIPKMKNEFKDDIRNKLLSQKLIEREMMKVEITQKDVEEFYTKFKDSIPNIPEAISVYRIVKKVKPKMQQKEDIFKLALKIRDSIIMTGDFERFAKTYSEDIATKNEGGDLGWIQKGKFLPELEKVGFSMLVGEISLPIETPLGFHIIKLKEKKKDEINVSHILFRLGQGEEEKEIAKRFLDSIRSKITNLEDFKKIAKQYSDDEDTKGFGGFVGNMTLESFPASVAEALKEIKEGEITKVLPYETEINKQSYQILFKEKTIPSHKANIEQDFQILQQQAQQYKRMTAYNQWIESLRKKLYWEIIPN